MKREFKVIFTYSAPSLVVEDATFNSIDTGEICKQIMSHLQFNEDYYEYTGEQVEVFTGYYDDDVEDYKDVQEDCINAFCIVHNIAPQCVELDGEGEDKLLETLNNRMGIEGVEGLFKTYKPFFWAYVYCGVLDWEVRDEYYD